MESRSTSQWDFSYLADNQVVRSPDFGIAPEHQRVRYPIRLLRYWFGYQLLREEAERKGHPLDVLEVGVDLGQMLAFARSSPSQLAIASWTAVDAVMRRERLAATGYTDFLEVHLEDGPLTFPQQYDVAILLHVLEHLFEPERVFEQIVGAIRPGGVLIGGFPVVPRLFERQRERQIRRTARPLGHVSVFSPERVRRMAAAAGLELEFLSGAFLMRSRGSALENSAAWVRFNLAWGRLFPGWPGEIYWRMRRPTDPVS